MCVLFHPSGCAGVGRQGATTSVPPNVVELIERFQRNRDVYTRSEYKEPRARVEFTERQIDALVYELHGLTEEEIAIVEGQT